MIKTALKMVGFGLAAGVGVVVVTATVKTVAGHLPAGGVQSFLMRA